MESIGILSLLPPLLAIVLALTTKQVLISLMAAQKYAIEHGMFSVPSIRAGGVSDDPVADMGTAGGAAAVKLGPPKFGHAIHIVNSLLRAESEIEGSKPFDFTPFIKWDK